MDRKFKIIPTPIFRKKIFNKKSIQNQITEMLENILNDESRLGWEFVDIKTIVVPIKKSFFNSIGEKKLSILLFKKSNTSNSLLPTNTLSSGDDNYPSLGPASRN